MGERNPYFLKPLYAEKNKDTGLKGIVGEKRFQELVKKRSVKLFGGPIRGCLLMSARRSGCARPGRRACR